MSEYEGKYKYLCIGGFVRSKDGDRHYVHDGKLPALYGVHRHECLNNLDVMGTNNYQELLRTLVWLRPRSDGDYKTQLSILKANHLLEQ